MTAEIKITSPEQLPKPLGLYSHIAVAPQGRLIFVAGQVAIDKNGNSVGEGNIAEQLRQVLVNLNDALATEGLGFDNIVKFTTYLTEENDIEPFMEERRKLFPRYFSTNNYPPNTLLIVKRLVHKEFRLEIEAVAASA